MRQPATLSVLRVYGHHVAAAVALVQVVQLLWEAVRRVDGRHLLPEEVVTRPVSLHQRGALPALEAPAICAVQCQSPRFIAAYFLEPCSHWHFELN